MWHARSFNFVFLGHEEILKNSEQRSDVVSFGIFYGSSLQYGSEVNKRHACHLGHYFNGPSK